MSTELHDTLSSMTIGQWEARRIVKAANILAYFVETSPTERVNWRPAIDASSVAQSMMEQLVECTFANVRFRHYLTGATPPDRPATWETNGSVEEVTHDLKESARLLAEVVSGLDTAGLAAEYATHRGALPGALAIQFPVRNMTYHMGQINMIQLLYGDKEFHINEEFLSF